MAISVIKSAFSIGPALVKCYLFNSTVFWWQLYGFWFRTHGFISYVIRVFPVSLPSHLLITLFEIRQSLFLFVYSSSLFGRKVYNHTLQTNYAVCFKTIFIFPRKAYRLTSFNELPCHFQCLPCLQKICTRLFLAFSRKFCTYAQISLGCKT